MINIETLFYRAGDHVICRMLQHAAFGNRCTVNLNKALTALGKQPIALDSIPEQQICFLREKYSELDFGCLNDDNEYISQATALSDILLDIQDNVHLALHQILTKQVFFYKFSDAKFIRELGPMRLKKKLIEQGLRSGQLPISRAAEILEEIKEVVDAYDSVETDTTTTTSTTQNPGKRSLWEALFENSNYEFTDRLGQVVNSNIDSLQELSHNQQLHQRALNESFSLISFLREKMSTMEAGSLEALTRLGLNSILENFQTDMKIYRSQMFNQLENYQNSILILEDHFQKQTSQLLNWLSAKSQCDLIEQTLFCAESAYIEQINAGSLTLVITGLDKTVSESRFVRCLPQEGQLYEYAFLHHYKKTSSEFFAVELHTCPTVCLEKRNNQCKIYYSADTTKAMRVRNIFYLNQIAEDKDLMAISCNEDVIIGLSDQNLTCTKSIMIINLTWLPATVYAKDDKYFITRKNFKTPEISTEHYLRLRQAQQFYQRKNIDINDLADDIFEDDVDDAGWWSLFTEHQYRGYSIATSSALALLSTSCACFCLLKCLSRFQCCLAASTWCGSLCAALCRPCAACCSACCATRAYQGVRRTLRPLYDRARRNRDREEANFDEELARMN